MASQSQSRWGWRPKLLLVVCLATASAAQTPQSTFFSTAAEESYSTYQLPGDGDLWPSCWSDDDNLYGANGDGTAFTGAAQRYDMAVSVISGMPPQLSGHTVATDVGTNWSGPNYNRKPTGMLCRNGIVYLAFQNLNLTTFTDTPAASIAQSTDHGQTWTWDASAPMFGTPGNPNSPNSYKFTTVFFLDYGKDSKNAIDNYVYAYGLDNSWREQQMLYLARVPSGSVLMRSAWEFYAGADNDGNPLWTADITQKVPVLTDNRLLYPVMFKSSRFDNNGPSPCPAEDAVIGQGGVVYDAPLQRYILASWSCATHEFYEAPRPWGPWSHFLSNDFGPLLLVKNRGQYGTSIPSKFISSDGKTLYLQSNVCCGGDSYTFSLRKVYLETYTESSPTNTASDADLASAPGARAISKSTHFGSLCSLNCADQLSSRNLSSREDDYDQEAKPEDWWGYTWPRPYNINQVVFQTGTAFPDGGWYSGNLRVQVRQNFVWSDVPGVTIVPAYPYSSQAGTSTYSFHFPEISGDGIRLAGTPGGSSHFTSITQLAVYYQALNTPDYSIALTPAMAAISGNQTAQVTLSVIPTNGFNQQITFGCSGLPSSSKCTISPASVRPDGTGATAQATITVAANVSAELRHLPPDLRHIFYCLALLGAVTLAPRRRWEKALTRGSLLVLFAVLLTTSFLLLSCGSHSAISTQPGTPKGVYSITVSAAAEGETQRASFSLIVQ